MKSEFSTLARRAFVLLASVGCIAVSILGLQQPVRAAGADSTEKLLIPDKSWTCGMADGIPVPERGVLVFKAELTLAQIYDVGKTPYGRRRVCVVGGGKFTGDKFQGTALFGGLDLELTLTNGVVEIEQLLVLQAKDGSYIYMRSFGTGLDAKDARVVFDFEAKRDGAYAWLNEGKYVGRRTVDAEAKTMTMTVFEVSAVTMRADEAQTARIAKPADSLPQPSEDRKAAPTEKRGEPILTEFVTLGASQTVGPSKRGGRNIIPITGGDVTGMIEGKVLPGGADYQLAPLLHACYLWRTTEGDIVIVRNDGPFGSLVPTFETSVDGKHAWLNEGHYLSSEPQVGAGGVRITMFKVR